MVHPVGVTAYAGDPWWRIMQNCTPLLLLAVPPSGPIDQPFAKSGLPRVPCARLCQGMPPEQKNALAIHLHMSGAGSSLATAGWRSVVLDQLHL